MKKLTSALLFIAAFCYAVSSCHKPDFPHKKDCQLKSIEQNFNYLNGPAIAGQTFTYSYTSKRLLDSITGIITPAGTPFIGIKVGYNNQGLPISGGTNQKLVYENGHVVRIETLGADNLYHTLYTYTYDTQGRVTERVGNGTVRWEYGDNTRNFIRKLEIYGVIPGTGQPEISVRHQYQYDTKLNPWNTWPNTTLNPYDRDPTRQNGIDIDNYEPIPENNITFHAVDNSFRGALLRADEYYYTYEYDDVYPVKRTMLQRVFRIFLNSVDTIQGTAHYTYDCNGKGKNF